MAAEVVIDVRANDNFSGVLGNFGSIITGIESAINLLGQAFDFAVNTITPFVNSASESEQAIARLEGVLRATGTAIPSGELFGLAESLQAVTRFSDETILAGTSLLLTFRNIDEDTLYRTIPAMLDMAEIFGSVDSAAMQLGKALNEPTTMLGALSRAGVTFSEEQKEMIKNFVEMGDIASAQNIILSEVEKQVGGLSEAMGQTFSGQLAIAKNAIDELRETLGAPFLTLLTGALGAVTEFVNSPAIQSLITDMADKIADFVAPFELLLQIFSMRMEAGADPLTALITTLEGANMPEIQGFIDGMLTLIGTVQTFIETGQTEGWSVAISNLLVPVFDNLDLSGRFEDFLNGVAVVISNADWAPVTELLSAMMSTVIKNVFLGLDIIINEIDWGPVGEALWNGLIEVFMGVIDSGADALIQGLADLFTGGDVGKLQSTFKNIGGGMGKAIVDGIKDFLGISSPSTVFMEIGKSMVEGLIAGWLGAFGSFLSVVSGSFSNLFGGGQSTGVQGSFPTGFGGTSGGLGGTVVNQYFQGATINVGSWDQIAYDCLYPNPFVAATSGQLGGGTKTR